MRRSVVVQVRKRRSGPAKNLKNVRNFSASKPLQVGAHRLTRDPSPQVSGPATCFTFSYPVVVCGRDGRVISVREMSSLGKKPGVMGGIGCGHQRKGPAESVRHLLVVPLVAEKSDGAP